MATAFTAPLIQRLSRTERPRHARHTSTIGSRCVPTCTAHLSRRALLYAGALAVLLPNAKSIATAGTENAKVTDRVFFDVKIAGVPRGRITIGLFGNDAPESVATFKTVTNGALRGRGGRSAGYRYSLGSKVVYGRFVELGKVVQIDALNQSAGTPQRQPRLVEAPENRDENSLTHDAVGVVSVRRGGGRFEFDIALAPDCDLDQSNIVIGRVVGGDDVIQLLANVPTTQRTKRDGFRNVGRAIGDARAKVDLDDKPLQKIQVYECGVL